MDTRDDDRKFIGSIPQVYEEYMVPLFFAHYADDLVARLALRPPARVLELAAGTGALTRRLTGTLPPETAIVATDLNPAMLKRAADVGTSRGVQWRAADAQQLPFEDASFDAVLCQFGLMFFPDKVKALAEARRVLSADGVLLFNVWDRIEQNEFAHTVSQALEAFLPDDPPRIITRTPHGYFDVENIRRDVALAGFRGACALETVAARSRAASARIPAIALCQGTPLRGELEARGASLAEVTEHATNALARRFGAGPVEGKMQAHVVTVAR